MLLFQIIRIGAQLGTPDANSAPIDLNSTTELTLSENLTTGTFIGIFNATDPEGDAITFHLPAGDNNNSLFTIDTNGTLKTATVLTTRSMPLATSSPYR